MTTIRAQVQTTLTTAADALHGEEIARTRLFLQVGWIIAVVVVGAVLALPGDPRIGRALLAIVAITVLGSFWSYGQLRIPSNYDARQLNVLAFAAIVSGELGILYVGIFSAAPLIVALGVFFFCRTEHRASAIGVYALAALSHAVHSTLVISGLIPDPGFSPVRADCSVEAQIAGQLILQQLYAGCFFLARITRKTSLKAIDQLQKATRLAAQRDAQVAELRQDLDRALKIGGPGRFTGHRIGSWELGTVLGRGAMGEVYEATHTKTQQVGAVKLLRRELLSDPHHVERFFREVRIASQIDSPNVVRVLEASSPSDQIPFLAMELLRGHTLGEVLRAGPLTGARLAGMITQIGGVLELARAAGIVHRDLKPHNLFLTEDGVWKVLDFGVALLADTSGTLTQGAVIGTPAYMAPEQARGETVDHRADVYALAAVIYRCLTGRVPFVAKDTPALLYAVVHVMPLRPSAFGPVTPQVEAFLALALAKSRDARFQTADDLVRHYAEADDNALPPELLERARMLARRYPWTEPEKLAPAAAKVAR
ncbi:MAG: serine/threonine protein kinase [Myxococcales bacterium]|nr:serine/threonine protein kinase [Myxococcales bacterium]